MSAAQSRLLVIGNSHAAAPRLAYARDPLRWPGHRIDFLAVRGGGIAKLQLQGSVLSPADAKTAEEMQQFNKLKQLDLAGFDAIALIGGFGWANMAALFGSYRSVDFPSVLGGDEGGHLLGCALMQQVLRSRMRRCYAARLAAQLIPLGKPLVMIPEPLPSAECYDDPVYADYLAMAERGDALYCRLLFQQIAADEMRGEAILPFWPEGAIVEEGFTDPAFMRAAPRLSVDVEAQHAAHDFAHGNVAYGALVIDRIVQSLPAA